MRRCLGFLTFAALIVPVTLAAQIPRSAAPVHRAPDKNATQILIHTFKSADRSPRPTLGAKAAAEMRKQLTDAFPAKDVYVIPEHALECCRGHGQFDTEEILAPHDAKALASMLRADEYVVGSIERTSKDGYRVQAELALTRDFDARQPLGFAESQSMSDAIRILVREMKEARKQMAGDRKCTSTVREGLYQEAIQHARGAIAAYPKATIARMCLALAFNVSKAPQDSVLKVAREILALDPRNSFALRLLP